MTLKGRIAVLLATAPGRMLCGRCIARALDVSVRRLGTVLLGLDPVSHRRRSGICSACGANRLVTAYVSAATGTR